jgi:hypothetical protein
MRWQKRLRVTRHLPFVSELAIQWASQHDVSNVFVDDKSGGL